MMHSSETFSFPTMTRSGAQVGLEETATGVEKLGESDQGDEKLPG
jgi:hypothetical protein